MATDTATIRVARDTRDLLAEQARVRGISLAALLAEIAREQEIEEAFESERQAVSSPKLTTRLRRRRCVCGSPPSKTASTSTMASASEPRRGEVWLVSFGAARPGEPGKNRPAVVVSVDRIIAGPSFEPIVVVPLSSSSTPSVLRPEVRDIRASTGRVARCPPRAVRGVARSRLLRRLGLPRRPSSSRSSARSH